MNNSEKSVVKGTLYSEVEELKRQRNREAAARYRDRNRALVTQRMRDWRNANKEESRKQSREWRNRKLANSSPEEVAKFRAMESAKTKRLQAVCKDAVFTAYGGYKCACCGEIEAMFLSIDHIHNNGNIERKAGLYSGNGTGFYQWLRKNNFPSGYQVLCMNCQIGKHKNGGVCPHQNFR
jgi:hypothetical protein